MEKQYTSGKWYVGGELRNQVKTNIHPYGILLANVNPINAFSEREAMANAQLMATAPEMFDALTGAKDCIESVLGLFEEQMAETTRFGLKMQLNTINILIKKATEL